MATMKKAAVKITGTAKSTGGNMKNQPMKKAATKAVASKAKRPFGELPKRMSGFAQVIAEGYPELGKSGAAARAGKIRKEFSVSNKAAAAKKAAVAKKTK